MKKITIFTMAVLLLFAASAQADLVALYHFDGNADDDSGNNNDGTVNGGAGYDTGVFGQAISLDGSDDYVDVGDLGVIGDWTIEFFVKFNTLPSPITYPIGIGPGADMGSGIFMGWTGGSNAWGLYDGAIPDTGHYFLGSAVSIGVWYHVAVTKSGTIYTIYLDGLYENSGTLDDIDISDLQIGRRLDGTTGRFYIDGLIDEVRIWDEALTDLPGSLPVEIDIKPGSYPSTIQLRKKGVVPVAIHTTAYFDATTVDPETVELNGVPIDHWEIYDCDEIDNPDYVDPITTPLEPEMIGDGDLDLVVYFSTPALKADAIPELIELSTTATLTGETFDGMPIEGTGDVRIIQRGKP